MVLEEQRGERRTDNDFLITEFRFTLRAENQKMSKIKFLLTSPLGKV